MDETQKINNAERADTLALSGGDGVHDQWALHAFAFEQESDWLPVRLRRYHRDRRMNGELMEGYYDEFIPVPYDCGRGSIVKKDVTEETTMCDECNVAARRYDGDTLCPECGLLCSDSKSTDNLVRDPKAANRLADNSGGSGAYSE